MCPLRQQGCLLSEAGRVRAGIPAEVKDRISDRGFGENTGLGLFLVREILSISGINISENGDAGSGARFTITVPRGTYRFVHETA